jgi:hypothetical protein
VKCAACGGLLLQALALTRPTGFVRLADYGTADGGTSMPLLLQLVDAVRRWVAL